MKYIIPILLVACVFIQCGTTTKAPSPMIIDTAEFDALWQKVDSLESEGLYASALDQLNSLIAKAQSAGAKSHIVKALFYQAKFNISLQEDAAELAVKDFEFALNQESNASYQRIYHSILGQLYTQYAQQNQYKIRNRTKATTEAEGIAEMSLAQLINKSNDHYHKSVEELSVENLDLKNYDLIIEKQKSANSHFDLYSLLLLRAINHFKNDMHLLTEPTYASNIYDPKAFSNLSTFISTPFKDNGDKQSYRTTTLQLYQKLLSYHKDDVLVDQMNIARLDYVYRMHKASDKKELYRQSLVDLVDDSQHAKYALAQLDYDANNKSALSRERNVDAYRMLNDVIDASEDQDLINRSKNLLQAIEQPLLNLAAEKVIVPESPSLFKIDFKNIDNISFTIKTSTNKDIAKLGQLRKQEDQLKFINSLNTLSSWSQTLPQSDYTNVSSELMLEGLDIGNYIILAESSSLASFSHLIVSNLAYAVSSSKTGSQYIIVDRKSGKPLEGVKAEFFQRNYDRGQQNDILVATLTSDVDGQINYKHTDRKAVFIRLQDKTDILDLRQAVNPIRERALQSQSIIHTFLDRNIYRPGQRVYIKALVLETDEKGVNPVSAIKNDMLSIIVRDVNRKEIYKVEKSSNEYGSISADFKLPAAGLGGQYSLEIQSASGARSYTNLRVEEYKRPTFASELTVPNVAFKLGDTITVTGKSEMFSGPALDGAIIDYRITRNKIRYFNWYRHSSRGGRSGESAEIKNGKTTTNSSGEFQIPFTLKAGSSTPHNGSEIYIFTIDITAIDITGESQTATTQLRVSQKDLFVSSNIDSKTDLQSEDSILIESKNINNSEISFNGLIKIYSLVSPNSFKKSKYWSDLDTTILKQADYQKLLDEYKLNESNPSLWEIDNEVYAEEFSSTGKHSMAWPTTIAGGYHKIEIQNRDNGDIEYETITNIFDFSHDQFDITKIFENKTNKESYLVNDLVDVSVGSAHEDVNVYYQLEKSGAIVDQKWITLNSDSEQISIPVEENDKGGFIVYLTSFYKNRVQQERLAIAVPYVDKQLKIRTETFKSSLEPGSDEEWSFSIVDNDNKPVQAEIVASMYDASLDAISYPHNWTLLQYQNYRSTVNRMVPGYQLQFFRNLKYWESKYYELINPTDYYPQLNFFGYMMQGQHMAREGRVMKSRSSAPAPEMAMEDSADAEMSMYNETSVTEANESGSTTEAEEFDWSHVRDVLDETVFFYPQLVSNADGQSTLKFRMSEALSSWKLQLFVHDPMARYGYELLELKTQKDLSIYPNVPRFLRVADELSVSAKVVNNSEAIQKTSTTIQFINPDTNEDVTDKVINSEATMDQVINAGSSMPVVWSIHVDETMLSGLIYRMRVEHNLGSDAIEGFIPVTSNRVLLTESLPLYVGAKQSKTYVLDNLDKIRTSKSADIDRFTIEYSSNPSWYVFQALPFLDAPEIKSSNQLLNQYISHSIARSITQEFPEIKAMLQNWERKSKEARSGALQRNQELKIAKLEETPWLRQSISEEEQQAQLIKFYNKNESDAIIDNVLTELLRNQNPDGGFSWLPGRQSNEFISSTVLESIGRLNNRNIYHNISDQVISQLVAYIDVALKKIADKSKAKTGYSNPVQLLYAKSFFIDEYGSTPAFKTLLTESLDKWQEKPLHIQAQLALISNRVSDEFFATKILKSLREQMISTDDKGAYWKLNRNYYSNHSSIDKQVMMIELFHELGVEQEEIDQLRIWLLRNKQTNHWKTNQSTASAIFAFLMNHKGEESNWLNNSTMAEIKVADKLVEASPGSNALYIKEDMALAELDNLSNEIVIDNPNNQAGWGAAYIQYYDDIEKVQGRELSELSIKKEVFKVINTNEGPQLQEVGQVDIVPGDKLTVRLIVKTDRSLEYVQIRDERASGFEPSDVLSGFTGQDALFYYQETKDASTNFFISRIPRGTHVLEYSLRANLKGSYSSGMATIQCMYASEFISHSNSINVEVSSGI